MQKQNSMIFIGIPLLVVAIVVAAAVFWRFSGLSSVQPSPIGQPVPASVPKLKGSVGTPKNGFGAMPTPVQPPGAVSDLFAQLGTTSDDGGAADFAAIASMAASL